jgi:hypothetical protein
MRLLLLGMLFCLINPLEGQEKSPVAACVKQILQNGHRVSTVLEHKLHHQVNCCLQVVQRDFKVDQQIWDRVMHAVDQKIGSIALLHNTSYDHALPLSEPGKTIHRELIKARVPLSSVLVEYTQNPTVMSGVTFDEHSQRYILTFNKSVAETIPFPYLRAITQHEATHIRYGDCLKLKYVENLLLCLGNSAENIAQSTSWQKLNYAVEKRADQLPMLTSPTTSQDIKKFVEDVVFDSSNKYNQSNYHNGNKHPSPFQRLLGVNNVVSYLEAEQLLLTDDTQNNTSSPALEA